MTDFMADYNRIKFYGNSVMGQAVHFQGLRAMVKKTDAGWESAYSGDPSIHNEWKIDPVTGSRSRSCSCPRIIVGTFKTRKVAAEAALAKHAEELRLRQSNY